MWPCRGHRPLCVTAGQGACLTNGTLSRCSVSIGPLISESQETAGQRAKPRVFHESFLCTGSCPPGMSGVDFSIPVTVWPVSAVSTPARARTNCFRVSSPSTGRAARRFCCRWAGKRSSVGHAGRCYRPGRARLQDSGRYRTGSAFRASCTSRVTTSPGNCCRLSWGSAPVRLAGDAWSGGSGRRSPTGRTAFCSPN